MIKMRKENWNTNCLIESTKEESLSVKNKAIIIENVRKHLCTPGKFKYTKI